MYKFVINLIQILVLAFVLGCSQSGQKSMEPEQFAKYVSDLITDSTYFHFVPSIQEFEQDGVYLYDVPSKEKGTFLARSVLKVKNSQESLSAYLAVNQQAGDLEIFVNGDSIYKNNVDTDEYLNHVDYGLFEFHNKVKLKLESGEHQLLIKFSPLNEGRNRVHISFISTENALPIDGIELKSPSTSDEFKHYGYWWLGPLSTDQIKSDLTSHETKIEELITQQVNSIQGKVIRWDVPKLHLVKSLPGWLTYQNWHYSGGTFLDAMDQVNEHFENLDYKEYIENHREFLSDNIDEIKQMRTDYGMIEGPFGHYFRASLLDDMGMQTVPYVNKLLATSLEERAPDSFESELTNRVVDHIMNSASRLPDGTFARFTPDTMSVWADDLFMGSIILLKAAELSENDLYLDEVVKQVKQFDSYLLDESSGLYWHGYFSKNREHSSSKWGRANGWTMMAKVELLKRLSNDDPRKGEIMEIFQRHAHGLLKVQSPDGRWHQVLDDPDSYLETSATAMFVRAFAAGVNEGWLDAETYKESAIKGWNSITKQIDENGDIIGIVRGTPILFSDEEYDNWGTRRNDPRGLGALLYAAVEMDKLLMH